MRTYIGMVLMLVSIMFADSECLLVPITLVAISVWLMRGALTDERHKEDM